MRKSAAALPAAQSHGCTAPLVDSYAAYASYQPTAAPASTGGDSDADEARRADMYLDAIKEKLALLQA